MVWEHSADTYTPPCVTSCPVTRPCSTLSPVDRGPPGSSVHGVFQARVLDWPATSYSSGSSWPRDGTHVSQVSCIDRRILHDTQHLRSPVSKRDSQWEAAV